MPKQEVSEKKAIPEIEVLTQICLRPQGIVGQNVFTGCLYDLPNWASLTWILLLVVECELHILYPMILLTDLLTPFLLAILAFLTIYKCRKYGEFTPTSVALKLERIMFILLS